MANTLKYVSIQHELGMSIGMALRLQPMLAAFSRVCLRRLGLAAVHFHFLQGAEGEPVLHGGPDTGSLGHFLSVPRNSPAPPPPRFERIAASAVECVHWQSQEAGIDLLFYAFDLGGFGTVTLQRLGTGLDAPIIELLKPLIIRLGLSCQASIEHENLLQAVAAREHAEQTILFQLLHDDLTRLPNRRYLMQRLDAELARAISGGTHGALLFLDLDRFKVVNDTLGHAVGDQLLVAVAANLGRIVADAGIVCRLSGDEFVILLASGDRSAEQTRVRVDELMTKIRAGFSNALAAGDHLLHVTPSTGIEVFPDGDCSADQILRRADTAMYQAKLNGLNSSVYYDRQLSAGLERRREIEKELQLALKDLRQFDLHYQTQHNLAGECIGAEALIRWDNPCRDRLSPATFVPIAEETGLMLELGGWVIRRACADIKRLQAIALPPTFRRVSINVSAIQFNHASFIDSLLGEIDDAGIDARLLAIELTETTLVRNNEAAAARIALLQTRGIEVAVDDFGTGYSSLSYLSRLPVESIKIDQTFVRNIDSDAGNRAIVETIVALGHALGIDLIAEGVETEAERACLQALGCFNYQGFLFSRPVALVDLIDQLQHRPALSQRTG